MIVAGGVTSILHIERTILHLLGASAGEESVLLLGDNVGDESTLGLEIIFHRFGFIFAAFILEYRIADNVPGGIYHSGCIHGGRIHLHAYLLCIHFEFALVHRGCPIQISIILTDKHQRIFGRKMHHIIDIHLVSSDFRE